MKNQRPFRTQLSTETIITLLEAKDTKQALIDLLSERVENTRKSLKDFNLTARNSPTSKVAGCKGFGLVQGLAPCA